MSFLSSRSIAKPQCTFLFSSLLKRSFSTKFEQNPNVNCREFGETKKGEKISLYTLKNDNGMEMEVINYGGSVRCLRVPNKKNELTDVVIGLDNIEEYQERNDFFGCIAGRVANRIKDGKFVLNDKEYQLPLNNGPNSLHGGFNGFDKQVWKTDIIDIDNELYSCGINLHYLSPDNDENYPGLCDVNVKYLLHRKENVFEIQYYATTDDETIINLTNHSYFNLEGNFIENGICDGSHSIKINSDYITPITSTLIPDGTFMNVNQTPFDFKDFEDIGLRINDMNNEQIKYGPGYDHNYVINRDNVKNKNELVDCATLIAKNSGIKMIISTDQPGVQFYSGNFLTGNYNGKGFNYPYRSALCLETQHFPDSINQPNFPSIILKKDTPFTSVTWHTFSTV